MPELLQWPDEFDDPTPKVWFAEEFAPALRYMVKAGAQVTAESGWSSFQIEREGRKVWFIRRGRFDRIPHQCWEVLLYSGSDRIRFSRVFGIRDQTCVITLGNDNVRAVAELWIGGCDIETLASTVEFWDRMDASAPLVMPTKSDRLEV